MGPIERIFVIRKKFLWRSEYKLDNTHICVLNLTVGFLLQLAIVVPLTLFVIVVHNWVLGPFVCYALPILQVSKSILKYIIFSTSQAHLMAACTEVKKIIWQNHWSTIVLDVFMHWNLAWSEMFWLVLFRVSLYHYLYRNRQNWADAVPGQFAVSPKGPAKLLSF